MQPPGNLVYFTLLLRWFLNPYK